MHTYTVRSLLGVALASMLLTSTLAAADSITLYSGRGEALVKPLISEFTDQTGITVNVRYGGTAELAVLLQEEGDRSPADLYWAQDAGALGATASAGLFAELPADLYADLPAIYTSDTGTWLATSGRARVLAYSTLRASAAEVPASIADLTDERYQGRVGWAPTNGSFQAHVTAMRIAQGDEFTRDWLVAMRDNNTQVFRNNTALVQGIANGEIDFAITNNYYLLRFLANDPDFPVAQQFFEDGDIGNVVNVAGIGILASSSDQESARTFVRFLLADSAQQYFTDNVYEYPVIASITPNPELESFERLLAISPTINLDALEDLEGTLALLREVNLL